jgi:hypothetical protein
LKFFKSVKNKQLVEVIFDDPAEYDTNIDDKKEPVRCKAIGWLDKKNSSFVRISWLTEIDDEAYVGLAIPMGCVKKIRNLGDDKKSLGLGVQ